MRELGRLLSKARELSESVSSLSTLIDPCKFKIVVDAVKAVCGFDDSSHKFITPSLGLKLGHSLKKCAAIVKSRGLQNDDDATVQQADKFIQLCESDWPEAVSSHALRTLEQRQWNKPKRLPLAADVVKVKKHLNDKCDLHKATLQTASDTHAWYEWPKLLWFW